MSQAQTLYCVVQQLVCQVASLGPRFGINSDELS